MIDKCRHDDENAHRLLLVFLFLSATRAYTETAADASSALVARGFGGAVKASIFPDSMSGRLKRNATFISKGSLVSARRTLSSETASFGHRPFSSSQPEEHSESFPHVGEDLNGGGRGEFHAPSVPIQILNVIR